LLTKLTDLLALLLGAERRIMADRLHLGAGSLFNLFSPLDRRLGNANLLPAGSLARTIRGFLVVCAVIPGGEVEGCAVVVVCASSDDAESRTTKADA